jgi:two-component system, response regulator PdtaR
MISPQGGVLKGFAPAQGAETGDKTSLNRHAIQIQQRRFVPPVQAPDHRRGRDEDATPRQVLIVEDEFFVALDLETTLQNAGFDVVGVANNALDAVRLAEAHKPSLIVMDVRLAGERDGIDAAIEIFERFGIRCVFASAHHDPGTKARAARANAAGWLAKPYSSQSLLATVEAAIDSQGSA